MNRFEGKVAFISGLARGQGRAHAVRLASEGADIVGLDLCGPVSTTHYPGSTPEDLAETVRLVEKFDRRIVASQGDVRASDAVATAVARGLEELGHVDIVVANAGITSLGALWELTDE